MSISFYGLTADKKPIMLEHEDPAFLNMSNGNARAFLAFLRLLGSDEPWGDASIPDARRAVMRARATFDRNVDNFTREGSDTQRPGRCRVIEGGIGLPPISWTEGMSQNVGQEDVQGTEDAEDVHGRISSGSGSDVQRAGSQSLLCGSRTWSDVQYGEHVGWEVEGALGGRPLGGRA